MIGLRTRIVPICTTFNSSQNHSPNHDIEAVTQWTVSLPKYQHKPFQTKTEESPKFNTLRITRKPGVYNLKNKIHEEEERAKTPSLEGEKKRLKRFYTRKDTRRMKTNGPKYLRPSNIEE